MHRRCLANAKETISGRRTIHFYCAIGIQMALHKPPILLLDLPAASMTHGNRRHRDNKPRVWYLCRQAFETSTQGDRVRGFGNLKVWGRYIMKKLFPLGAVLLLQPWLLLMLSLQLPHHVYCIAASTFFKLRIWEWNALYKCPRHNNNALRVSRWKLFWRNKIYLILFDVAS